MQTRQGACERDPFISNRLLEGTFVVNMLADSLGSDSDSAKNEAMTLLLAKRGGGRYAKETGGADLGFCLSPIVFEIFLHGGHGLAAQPRNKAHIVSWIPGKEKSCALCLCLLSQQMI